MDTIKVPRAYSADGSEWMPDRFLEEPSPRCRLSHSANFYPGIAISGEGNLSEIRDKAVSVGEGSHLSASALEIHRVGIGVASKNGSTVEITDSTLREVSDVGLVAYMNQPEYGPGSLVATGNRITRTALPALAQLGSHLVLDGSTLRPVDAAIDRLYKD